MFSESLSVNQQSQNHLLRNDLQETLTRSHIDPAQLSTFQRILLTTDGTVTHILEAYLFEEINVVKLSEKLVGITEDVPHIELKKGTEVIIRKILLRGRISRRNFIYAESIIIPERLEEKFKYELLNTKTPIGKIWFEGKIETFKEIVDSGREPANVLSNYFGIRPEDNMLFRTYRVFSNKNPTMMITERFPESYFIKSF